MKRNINNIVIKGYNGYGNLPLPCIYNTLECIYDYMNESNVGYKTYIDLVKYIDYSLQDDDRYKYYI